MPPKTPYPTPSLQFHNGAWKIIWRWNGRQYSVSTGLTESDKLFAEQRRIEFAIALKKDIPAFPSECRHASSVVNYIEARYGVNAAARASDDPREWIGEYGHEIRGKNTPGWVRDSVSMLEKLEKLEKSTGGLHKATARKAAAYMADIAARRSAGTHNRTLTVFKKFYAWLVNTHRHDLNPFSAVKRMKEGKDAPIVYCTQAEREEIIAMAKESGWTEWLAIPIAFYSGMRREEIANFRWEDARLDGGQLVVTKTKTGTSRTLPLNATLAAYLESVPAEKRKGFVVDVLPGDDRVWRLNSLALKLKKIKRDAMLQAWNLPRPAQSKAKEYREKRKAWEKAKKAKETEIHAALERIGWNAFRHTFGSLLAQAGVSLDKISAWMGNTPEVCRRHYAQFIPRDRRDTEIDKL